ncbi:hypothetical protein ANRL1_03059 [Anaerolineae bacterium]|nr:hypothetical protein ANRL1_03059 [Anaerolineae bacterium]
MNRIWMFVLLALTTACASSTPTAVPTRAPVPTTAGALVEYHRTGGIVGFNDNLIVNSDGKATLTRRTGKFEFTLAEDQVKQIQTAFQSANFTALREPPSKLLVPDELSYLIIFQGKQFKTSDTTMPNELQPVLALLNGIIDTKGK